MRPAIKIIVDKLTHYPQAKYSHTDDSVTVDPLNLNGFVVTFELNDREIIVSSDLWHEHFDIEEIDSALNCFSFMLSDGCRIKVEYRGKRAVKATMESWENGEWMEDSTTGLFTLRFWQEKRIEYFQNGLIEAGKRCT